MADDRGENFHHRWWEYFRRRYACDKSQRAYLTFAPYITLIHALLQPDPSRRLTAEQALSHTWLMSFAVPTKHDLCGLPQTFDPPLRWRNAIGVVWAMSRFAKSNGA
jgi:serine/threonine protein kinase